jgi:hypothetical protein
VSRPPNATLVIQSAEMRESVTRASPTCSDADFQIRAADNQPRVQSALKNNTTTSFVAPILRVASWRADWSSPGRMCCCSTGGYR